MTETEVRVSEGWEVRGLDPVRGSFYLKLKIMNTCFKHGIFFTITWKTTYMDKAIIRNIVVCYKNFFAGIILLLKTSRNCLWWRYFLIKTQDYSLLPRTLLNSVTDDFMRVFWNSCTKAKLENNLCCGVPFKYKCTNAVYSLLPN